MTRCTWPGAPRDGKSVAVLFRAEGEAPRIRASLDVPEGVLLQFAPKGSYRLEHTLEYYRWLLAGR
eukprot:11906370-Alexandrium_andersonii.AAC.1